MSTFVPCSRGERHPHPTAVRDAQLQSPKALGPDHLPHRGGGEQCEREGGGAADVVHSHQNHTGPTEECQGTSSSQPPHSAAAAGLKLNNVCLFPAGVPSCPSTSRCHHATLRDADESQLARAGEEQLKEVLSQTRESSQCLLVTLCCC